MVELLEGSWVVEKNENFGELLEALGKSNDTNLGLLLYRSCS